MRKILLLAPKDNNFYNFRSELILKLKKLGYEVVLVCPYGKKIDYFTKRGCRFIDLKMDRRGKSIINDFKLLISYRCILKHENPDIVLTYTSKPSIYGGFVCGIMGIPYIVNNAGLMETTGFFDKFMKLLYWLGWRKASCMMYQNSHEREVIRPLLGENMRYRDIPGSGVNLEQFAFKQYPQDDKILVFNYVARIVDIKGINELLSCAEIIKKDYPNTRFILYGDYDDNTYKIKVQDFEKRGIVEYGGVQLNIKPCIEASHAVIHPSYYEGMTNVVLEHSAVGRPCIGSNIPGVKEGIENGKTGFLFEVKNVNSMVNAVKKFIALPYEDKILMGKEAREKMVSQFDRNIVSDIYIEEIKRIIDGE